MMTPVGPSTPLLGSIADFRFEAVIALTAAILPVVAVFQVFDGGAAVSGGVLRARGKQVTGALLNLRYSTHVGFHLVLLFINYVLQCILHYR